MSTILQFKNDQKPTLTTLVESDAKNALPTRITAMDMIGLSWIFIKDEKPFEEFEGFSLIK